ncbi:hypothetical protein KP509_31G030500 [Ceratopteris richardii]|uniref:Uncharacterized protein n=1 Tax=Ceratopteris richardii TaxID=49495 RepID=A0A8T2QYJ1_CERRI|nr:hypothetical protein KP509_31G030500 [Ceratopteris richardii]
MKYLKKAFMPALRHKPCNQRPFVEMIRASNIARRLHTFTWRSYRDSFSSLSSEGGGRENESNHVYVSDNFTDHKGMQLCFLGTSSSIPTLRRNTSCLALRLEKQIYLFDCGEGAQKQLYKAHFRFGSVGNIFITHMHGDHIFGLPGLLSGLGITTNSAEAKNIYGPEGLRIWIRETLKACHGGIHSKYAVHEFKMGKRPKSRQGAKQDDRHDDELTGQDLYACPNGLWHLYEDKHHIVKAGMVEHSIPCWGFLLEEKPRPGKFNVEQARKLGVKPGPDFAFLQKGHSVISKFGQKINPSDVLGHSRRGRKIVILGDTNNPRSLLEAAKGADVLVHECTMLEEDAGEAECRGHSTATIGARCLVLTHFGSKFEGNPSHIQASVQAARLAFGRENVIAAKDFMGVTVCQTDEPS